MKRLFLANSSVFLTPACMSLFDFLFHDRSLKHSVNFWHIDDTVSWVDFDTLNDSSYYIQLSDMLRKQDDVRNYQRQTAIIHDSQRPTPVGYVVDGTGYRHHQTGLDGQRHQQQQQQQQHQQQRPRTTLNRNTAQDYHRSSAVKSHPSAGVYFDSERAETKVAATDSQHARVRPGNREAELDARRGSRSPKESGYHSADSADGGFRLWRA